MSEQFTLHRAETMSDALARLDEDHLAYLGGTELIPAIRMGLRFPIGLIDIKRITELAGVSSDSAGSLRLGAATTHWEISRNDLVRSACPTLAECASHVGNARVRATGTIGGNLSFAEPRSDLACLLIACDAQVEIVSKSGTRIIGVDDLIVGAYECSLETDELISAVIVDPEPVGCRYWKFQVSERPVVGVAIVPRDGHSVVVAGALTERPIRVEIATGDRAAIQSFVEGLDVSADLSGSADYKRSVLLEHLEAMLTTEDAA